mmetsp:Transcript_4936/g.9953  ORF Transcript_4936/g.9953 Transcript_4936/m.9953 type:complete len:81 (+) Transcript_4936:170-412(+)
MNDTLSLVSVIGVAQLCENQDFKVNNDCDNWRGSWEVGRLNSARCMVSKGQKGQVSQDLNYDFSLSLKFPPFCSGGPRAA